MVVELILGLNFLKKEEISPSKNFSCMVDRVSCTLDLNLACHVGICDWT